MLENRTPIIDYSGLVRLPFPAEIAIETHSYCNLRCIICPYEKMKRAKGKMRPELFHKIIDEVAKESPDTRLWLAIMGEPLADENIVSYIHYAMESGARRIHLNTNGTFLEGSISEAIMESGIESIYIAIDAVTNDTYKSVRPGGSFDRVRRNVNNILELRAKHSYVKPEIVVQFIVMNENESEVDEFHDYWLKRGAVVKVRLRQGWGTNIYAPDLRNANIERIPCPWLLRTMNIHWTGRATQCDVDYEEEYFAGDINLQTIKEVWEGELARRRRRHWSGDFQHPLCEKCRDWASGRAEFFYPDHESETSAPRWSIGEKTQKNLDYMEFSTNE